MAMNSFRLIFMGNPDFAVPSLEALNSAGNEIVAVVTGTDKKRGRGSELTPSPVKAKALELGLHVVEADSMRNLDVELKLRALNADLFVVVAFKVLPVSLLKIPRVGSINLHASLLPKYRGAAPIHWAIKRGESETGVTIFFLDEQVDTGKYLLQKRVDIGPQDTTGDVYGRLMSVGAEALVEAVERIKGGGYELVPQNDADATSAPKLFTEDARIHFGQKSVDVVNHIRAMNPFPMAWINLDGKKLKVLSAISAKADVTLHPAEVRVMGEKLVVGTGDGCVELTLVQLEGKKVTTGSDFIRGYQGEYRLS
jgi:methionyl-tRNA formyltransferase